MVELFLKIRNNERTSDLKGKIINAFGYMYFGGTFETSK